MQTAFVFTEVEGGSVEAFLDTVGAKESDQWIVADALFVEIQQPPDWSDGWPDAVVEDLTSVFGHRPPCSVVVTLRGRSSAQREAKALVADLVQLGFGVAVDDFSGHLWTTEEIVDERVADQRRFLQPTNR